MTEPIPAEPRHPFTLGVIIWILCAVLGVILLSFWIATMRNRDDHVSERHEQMKEDGHAPTDLPQIDKEKFREAFPQKDNSQTTGK
jgi:hypothetical protein